MTRWTLILRCVIGEYQRFCFTSALIIIAPLYQITSSILSQKIIGIKVDEVSRQDDQKIRDGIDNAVETLSSGLGSAAGFTTGGCAA